jgi:hypothetical protein
MKALLDSDILGYRIAFACENETIDVAKHRLDHYIIDILMCGVDNTFKDCFCDSWQLYLTGKNNFRYGVATTVPYKGNRVAPKPQHLQALRQHMIEEWGASVTDGDEADDAIAIDGTTLGLSCVMVSLDKDFDQIPGWHYNFVKKLGYFVDERQGLYSFYKQILTGDTADNIQGLAGIGPVKAAKKLAVCEDVTDLSEYEMAMYDVCVDAYEGNVDRVLENALLLWLRRTPNEMWTPPTLRK